MDHDYDFETEGEEAFKRGKDLEDNPHEPYTEPYEAWKRGWINAAEKQDRKRK